jgi:hypothetical protein
MTSCGRKPWHSRGPSEQFGSSSSCKSTASKKSASRTTATARRAPLTGISDIFRRGSRANLSRRIVMAAFPAPRHLRVAARLWIAAAASRADSNAPCIHELMSVM